MVESRAWFANGLFNRLNRTIAVTAIAALGVLSFGWASWERGDTRALVAKTRANPGDQPRLAASYGKLPLSFELNAGQTDARVRYLSRGPGYAIFLTGTEAVLSLAGNGRPVTSAPARDPKPSSAPFVTVAGLLDRRQGPKPASAPDRLRHMAGPAAFRLSLTGANPAATVTGLEELPGQTHYLIGSDPAQWRTNVPSYAKVRYQDVYPGIDLLYYGNPQQLEYDFLVAPGANPGAISFNLATLASSSAGELKLLPQIDPNGDLVIRAGEAEMRLHKPVVYQGGENSPRHFVESRYLLRGDDQVTFAIASYDPGKLLVIDPVLTYSSYLGGSGEDIGSAIAVDSTGSAYVTGWTSSLDFPTANALQASYGGNAFDAFVTKLTPDGSAFVYATYLGGSDGSDRATAIAVDAFGSASVTGHTFSTDFPTASPLQGSHGGGFNLQDAFVTKLSSDGSALVYSTYLGGSGEDIASAIALDSSGSAYVTGQTSSADFPTANPLQGLFGTNAFVTKLTPDGSALVYSTYLGGSLPWGLFTPRSDAGRGIAVDSSGSAYVTGVTTSIDFPTVNPLQGSHISCCVGSNGVRSDAFVTKLNPGGSALVYSTYLGGFDSDAGNGIAVDSSGGAYIIGSTLSTDFPTANALQGSIGDEPCEHAFVTKLAPDGSRLHLLHLPGWRFLLQQRDSGRCIRQRVHRRCHRLRRELSHRTPGARFARRRGI